MNPNTHRSKSIKPGADDALRDLIAAMPIVIFARALRVALQRPIAASATLLTSQSH